MQAQRAQGGARRRIPRMPWRLILLTRGEVTEAQLEEARELVEVQSSLQELPATANPRRDPRQADDLGVALVRLGHATEQQVAQARAAEAGCGVYVMDPQTPQQRWRDMGAAIVPTALLDRYGAVIVHLDRRSGRLMLGFVLRQEAKLLQGVAEVTGLQTEGCFVTASEFARLQSFRAAQGSVCDTGAAVADEPVAITKLVTEQALRSGADQIHLARVGNHLWLRASAGRQASAGSSGKQSPSRVTDRIFALLPHTSFIEQESALSTSTTVDGGRASAAFTGRRESARLPQSRRKLQQI